MKWMRWTAAVLVGVLLATGLVRAAGTQLGALRDRARRALEATGARRDVPVGDDDSGTPVLVFAGAREIAPGATADVEVTGTFGASTRFVLAGTGFTLSNARVAQNSFHGTITAAAAGALPGAAMLRATNRHGTAETRVAYRGGRWLIEGTTDNGWRVRLSPVASTRNGVLAFRGEFFDAGAKAPFTTRDAEVSLGAQQGDTATYTVSLKAANPLAGLGDAECDPIMARATELADKLMKANTQAEEDRISAEVDKIQDKIDLCMERQQDNADKISAKMKAASAQVELDAKKFGCTSIELAVAAGGAAEGTFSCAQVSPSFTGTMKAAGQ